MARSIFEDINEAAPSPRAPAPKIAPGGIDKNRRLIAMWLFVIIALVALMVIVGGLTRLTDSGLSITEWNLVFGVLPPLSEAAWQSEFALYQQTTEYQEINAGMSMADFRTIYWWEWAHRFLGRILGLAYLLPLVAFTALKRIPRGWAGRLWMMFALIALQGLIGWWMVSSGLTGRVDVAPYRLAAHLGLAFALFALLLWSALSLLRAPVDLLQSRRARNGGLWLWARILAVVLGLQILYGALVAGMDAGQHYTDWPLMGGQIFPTDDERAASGLANLIADPATTQFIHRLLAYALFGLGIFLWRRGSKAGHGGIARWSAILALALSAQMLLGIVTLMSGAPFMLAILHQFGGLLVVGAAARCAFEIAYPAPEKIKRG